ncbi:HNH endonuclease [Streptomyces sp. NPDC060209]|uniref:HNH endonuclease n=1 Tax=Streptomyces sp. NPDC060209 TaxID=3347073 RepID=UPI00365DD14D
MVLTANSGCCVYCGRRSQTMDHVIPLARGGADDLSNLVPACHACNNSKNDKTPAEWWTARWLKGSWRGKGTPRKGGWSLGLEDVGLRELYLQSHEQTLAILDCIDDVLAEIGDETRASWFLWNLPFGYPDGFFSVDIYRGWSTSKIEQGESDGWPDSRPAHLRKK